MAFGLASALLSLGGGLAGGILQNQASKSANKANKAAQDQAFSWLQTQTDKAVGAVNQGVAAAKEGFADATKSAAVIGQGARRRTLRRERLALGQADAQAANRGLYNSSAALNARRGARADTDLTLAAIDESVAGLHSQIFRDRARTLSSLHTAKAGLFQNLGAQGAQVLQSVPHVAAPVGQSVAGLTGSLAQLLAMYGKG